MIIWTVMECLQYFFTCVYMIICLDEIASDYVKIIIVHVLLPVFMHVE